MVGTDTIPLLLLLFVVEEDRGSMEEEDDTALDGDGAFLEVIPFDEEIIEPDVIVDRIV